MNTNDINKLLKITKIAITNNDGNTLKAVSLLTQQIADGDIDMEKIAQEITFMPKNLNYFTNKCGNKLKTIQKFNAQWRAGTVCDYDCLLTEYGEGDTILDAVRDYYKKYCSDLITIPRDD